MTGVWQDRAACRNAIARGIVTGPNDDPWFPKGNSELADRALAYCRSCPVTRECAAEAAGLRTKYRAWAEATRMQSVWGGKLQGVIEKDSPKVFADAIDARRYDLYGRGLNDLQMAAAEGLSVRAVTRWRQKHHLVANTQRVHQARLRLVAEQTAAGRSAQAIAARLKVAERTVTRLRAELAGEPLEASA